MAQAFEAGSFTIEFDYSHANLFGKSGNYWVGSGFKGYPVNIPREDRNLDFGFNVCGKNEHVKDFDWNCKARGYSIVQDGETLRLSLIGRLGLGMRLELQLIKRELSLRGGELDHFIEYGLASPRQDELEACRLELAGLAQRLAAMPLALCHRDYHAWNIHLQTAGDLMLVINAKNMFAAEEFQNEAEYYSGQIGKKVGTADAEQPRERNWKAGMTVYMCIPVPGEMFDSTEDVVLLKRADRNLPEAGYLLS